MGASAGKPPAAPDPNVVIRAQENANHYNSNSPFGSNSWSTGADGRDNLTTNLSPNMQGAVDRAFSAASTPYQKEYVPQGMDQLASAVLGRVGGHYGLQGSGLNTNLQQQKPAQGSPQPPQGMGGPMSQMQLQGSPGAGQMGGMSGLMGGMGGLSGGMPQNAMGAMQALQGQNSPMGVPPQMQQPGGFGASQQMGMPTMSGMGIGMQQPGGQMPPGRMG